jgi:hypothetical protein
MSNQELRRLSKYVPKVVMIAESSDGESNGSFDPKKVNPTKQTPKSELSLNINITSMDIVSKNGYLFKQIKHNDPSKSTIK